MAFGKIKKMLGFKQKTLQPLDDAITTQVVEALARNERASERLRALLIAQNNEMNDTINVIVGKMK